MSSDFQLPPGRAKWPIIGDTLQLLNEKTMSSYQVSSRKKFGSIWKTSVLFKKTVFITGADNLKAIFVEESKKETSAYFPPHHKKLFGQHSLLVQSGDYHAKLRRVIQQSLAPQVVSQLDPLITQMAREFVDECKHEIGTFKFVDKCRKFFIKIAVTVLLGNEASDDDLRSLTADISLWSKGLLAAPVTFIPWSTASRALRARKRIAKKLTEVIDLYKNQQMNGTIEFSGNNLLVKLVTTKDEVENDYLSTDAIVDNIFTLIFAGSDTTASAMSSAIKSLSLLPDLQDSLRQSVSDSAGEKNLLVPLDDFIRDIFSQNPPAPFSMRLVGKEPLVIHNYQVPSNWLVAYGYAGTVLGEDYPGKVPAKPENHLAFGGGPRMCPGRYLAIKEIKALLCEILAVDGWRWTLESDQNLNQTYTPGFFPIDGLQIRNV